MVQWRRQVFCTHLISVRFRLEALVIRIILERICIQCGKTFEVKIKSDPKKFCSKSCSATMNNKIFPKRKSSTVKCGFCGKDTTNPKFCSESCSGLNQRKITLDTFLSGKAISVRNTTIYEYLLKEQNNLCKICGIANEWNGSELIFTRDHIDGNSDNNIPENIRLICANCDTQLPTFKSRNRGNGRHYRRVRYSEGKSY